MKLSTDLYPKALGKVQKVASAELSAIVISTDGVVKQWNILDIRDVTADTDTWSVADNRAKFIGVENGILFFDRKISARKIVYALVLHYGADVTGEIIEKVNDRAIDTELPSVNKAFSFLIYAGLGKRPPDDKIIKNVRVVEKDDNCDTCIIMATCANGEGNLYIVGIDNRTKREKQEDSVYSDDIKGELGYFCVKY